MKKKSTMSNKGSCMSLWTRLCKDEAALEIMRISMKKEGDRKDKLERLLQKYDQIHTLEQQHVKTLKANIIVPLQLPRNSKTPSPSQKYGSWSTPTSTSITTSASKRGSSSA